MLGDIDANALTTFDIEYLFTKLRTKSVGESAKIELSCTKCEAQNPVTVPMDDVGVKGDMNQSNCKGRFWEAVLASIYSGLSYKTRANDQTVISGGAEGLGLLYCFNIALVMYALMMSVSSLMRKAQRKEMTLSTL